jgi:acetyltransferase-like isoleucine patch superfamily enzyme
MIKKYGWQGTLYLFFSVIRTKLLFSKARLIRFPIDIRGKRHIRIGTGFTTGTNCRLEALPIEPGQNKVLVIGDFVQMNDQVHITACQSVTIGNHVLMASKVYISDVSHGEYSGFHHSSPHEPPADRQLAARPVIIENNVWLGDGVCVLPGVTIGYGSIIGANAVVNRSIPSLSIAVGIPARVVKRYNEETKVWERIT